MDIYSIEEFEEKTSGGFPGQADWTPYLGKSYECACGTTHTFNESTEVVRELSGMRFVIQCPQDSFVTLITITMFANVKSLFGGKHEDTGPSEEETEATRTRANAGDADAQTVLGDAYFAGRGVPQDYAEAVAWTRQAAEQGFALAQFNLGVMYHFGHGVPEDDAEAVAWYRQAAEQGDASAQHSLGMMYANGEGVPEDAVEAVRWTRQAAEQGHAIAQCDLGFLYDFGHGVPQDLVEGYKWYSLATTYADAEQREVFAEARDHSASMLPREKLAEGQKLVEEWLAAHPPE